MTGVPNPPVSASAAQRFASAVRGGARKAVAADPVARGADWRLATVASTSGGTVTTTDGVKAGYLTSYTPTVGDQVVLSQSGTGNWVVFGKVHP